MSDRDGEQYRNRLLEALVKALGVLLESGEFITSVSSALAILGDASEVDRVYVFERHSGENATEDFFSQRFEWVRTGIAPEIDNPNLQNMPFSVTWERWHRILAVGGNIHGLVEDLPERERVVLEPQDILSIAIVPILVDGTLEGFIGFDDCTRTRTWVDSELQCFRAAAAALGGAMVRRKSEASLHAQAEELRRHRRVALSLMEDSRMAEQAAATANRAKSTFLAMMSHEIRTPLNGIVGFTDLLIVDELSEKQREIAHTIRSCGETLLNLITDILDISKIESGRLELEAENGDLLDCIRTVVAAFEPAAKRHGVTLKLSWEEEPVRWMVLDFNRLRQIFFNLIGNAVKFTRNGTVEIKIRTETCDAPGREVKLFCEVQDTGCGISEEDLQTIFEPFRQGVYAQRSVAGGTGLGLTICRRLIEAMGGSIEVTSALGQGSRFAFHLQAGRGTESPVFPVMERSFAPGGPAVSARILVVDDVRTNILLTTSLLKRLGYQADSAPGGHEAVSQVNRESYDLIFMDILMPHMDGYETTRQIRQLPSAQNGHRPWIVALTADVLVENRKRCEEAGMDDFLTKPVRLEDISQCLDRWKTSR